MSLGNLLKSTGFAGTGGGFAGSGAGFAGSGAGFAGSGAGFAAHHIAACVFGWAGGGFVGLAVVLLVLVLLAQEKGAEAGLWAAWVVLAAWAWRWCHRLGA